MVLIQDKKGSLIIFRSRKCFRKISFGFRVFLIIAFCSPSNIRVIWFYKTRTILITIITTHLVLDVISALHLIFRRARRANNIKLLLYLTSLFKFLLYFRWEAQICLVRTFKVCYFASSLFTFWFFFCLPKLLLLLWWNVKEIVIY